jgi:hypothetical protein
MASQEYYRERSIDIEKIKNIYNKAKQEFKGDFFDSLTVTDKTELHYGEIKSKKYPAQFFNSSLMVTEVALTCFHKKEEQFVELVKNNFFNNRNSGFSISYCEKESIQERNYSDFFQVWLDGGRYYLQTFCGSDSKLREDANYRFNVLNRYVQELGLPISIVGDEDEYRLIHKRGGFLKATSSSIFTTQPESFTVELVGFDAYKAQELLFNFVKLASNDTIYGYESSIGKSIPITNAVSDSHSMLKSFSENPVPADKYEVFYGFIINTIDALTGLQDTMKKRDSADISLFQIKYENQAINCSVQVKKDVLTLVLESRCPIDNLNELNVILGANYSAK